MWTINLVFSWCYALVESKLAISLATAATTAFFLRSITYLVEFRKRRLLGAVFSFDTSPRTEVRRFGRHLFRPLFTEIALSTIVVNCSLVTRDEGEPQKSLRAYVHSGEVIALQKISEELSSHGVALDVSDFYGIPDAKHHLLIGSQSNNSISDRILRSSLGDIQYIFSRPPRSSHAYFIFEKTKLDCEHNDNRVVKDYGIIVRKYYGNDRWVLLLAGIHMHGTLAAAMVALDETFQKKVRESKFQNFAQLVKVDVERNGLTVLSRNISWTQFELQSIEPLKQ